MSVSLTDEAARFRARPLIGSQYCIEIGMRNGGVAVHDGLDRPPNRWEVAPLFEEGLYGNLVGGIQNRRQSPAFVAGPAGQVQCRKIVIAGRRKLELRDLGKVEWRQGIGNPVRPGH